MQHGADTKAGFDRRDAMALTVAIVFPTLVTFVYFVALNDQSPALQQTAYAIGKAIQFGLPVGWAWWTGRLHWRRSSFATRGLGMGVLFGIVVALAMFGLYWGGLRSSEFFAAPTTAIRAKAAGMGVSSIGAFVAVGAFYSLVHSLLEEYYWRWFVFGLLRRDQLQANFGLATVEQASGSSGNANERLSFFASTWISSLGFMAHHVLLLATYFGWASPATYVFSFSVAVGGIAWAWLYERTGTLAGTWASHLLVDAAIFGIGFAIIYG